MLIIVTWVASQKFVSNTATNCVIVSVASFASYLIERNMPNIPLTIAIRVPTPSRVKYSMSSPSSTAVPVIKITVS